MLIKLILNIILGYVSITVEGFFTERFINICNRKKIFLWNIKRRNSTTISMNLGISDFKKVRGICKKTQCKTKINRKSGLPFVFEKYKKRKIFYILILIIIIFIVISSNFIWNIEIKGLDKINSSELLEELEKNGLSIGMVKRKVNTNEIINKIRLIRNDISWMEINLKGTNAIVSIVEAEKKPTLLEEDKFCDIISDKRGIIEKITVEKGTSLVKKGDIVEEGTPLIGGYMEGKYTEKRFVHAKGEIIAKVWYTKKQKSEFVREEKILTGKEEKRCSIKFNNFTINLYKSIPNFKKYDKINESKNIKLFSNFYLPIILQKDVYKEIDYQKKSYGKDELKKIIIKELEEEFQNDNIQDEKVLNKIVNVYYNEENTIEVELTYEVFENIGIENSAE